MLANLKILYKLLTPSQRREFAALQLLVILMGFAEVAGVLSISPFMALVGDADQIHGDSLVAKIYQLSGINDTTTFLVLAGAAVLLILTFAALVNIFTVWRFSMYAAQVGADLSNRLFIYYMDQSWLFHASENSNALVNKIVQEANRVSNLIIYPFMLLNARLVMAAVMSIAIFIYSPIIAFSGMLLFGLSYQSLYFLVRKRLNTNGIIQTDEQATQFKLMSEGFGGIKDTLILGRQEEFNKRFVVATNIKARAIGNTQTLTLFPKYLLELLAYAAVVSLVLFLIIQNNGNLGSILPTLSVFALAGFKLLPAFQLCYSSLGIIRGNMSSFENLKVDLLNSQKYADLDLSRKESDKVLWTPFQNIEAKNISFSYPNTSVKTLKNVSLDVRIGSCIGIVGSSGSGKSTLIDALLGLIQPSEGGIFIDGKKVHNQNVRQWQNSIGVVSQNIFLADSSIRENIAFGLHLNNINEEYVNNAIKLANLDEFISSLPDGIETTVGERGVQLSGGQRQRIGIARALYHDASVLVLDEATSSLDGITEKNVMDAIYGLSGMKTIIIVAHRLASVKKCSCIFLMNHGEIVDSGSFDDLSARNKMFKNMTELA